MMPKINVYLPDELAEAVRETGVPVSAICQRALEQAVRRVTSIRELTLSELGVEDLAARFPHFTARAQKVLRMATERAQATGAPSVGSGDILGALLAEGNNFALLVLRAMEIEATLLDRDLSSTTAAEAPLTTAGDTTGFNGPAAAVLELAVTEATSLGHNYIGCEHLLLGLIAEPDGVGGQVLRARGAEARVTRRAVTAALAGFVQSQSQSQTSTAADPAKALAAVIGAELRPILDRLDRLEQRVGTSA